MTPQTIPRPVARVLLIDSRDRVLLFRSELAYGTFWLTPGGGVDPGETYEQAAHRELFEETGLKGAELSPCIWTVRFTFPYEDRLYDQAERYYVVRRAPFEIDKSNWLPGERVEIQQHRWWTLDEISTSSREPFPARAPRSASLSHPRRRAP
jgi:8-oxo-dGTP diphosphatase